MRRPWILAALLFAPLPVTAQHQHAPRTEKPAAARVLAPAKVGPIGTLVIAHGGGPAWDAQVRAVAALVHTGGPLEVSFLMGPGAPTARFQDMARKLVDAGAAQIIVVPVLVSSHSGHYQQIRYLAGEVDELDETMMHHLHMSGIERSAVAVPMRVTPAFDDAPHVARVLTERALSLGSAPTDQALFIIGHGPNSAEDYAAWMGNLRTIADSVKARTGFRDVKVGLVRDDAPAPVRAEAVRSVRELIQLQYDLTKRPVVVVPVLVAKGMVSSQKIPADLVDLPIIYSGDALMPHPEIARWIEGRVRAASRAANAEPPHDL